MPGSTAAAAYSAQFTTIAKFEFSFSAAFTRRGWEPLHAERRRADWAS